MEMMDARREELRSMWKDRLFAFTVGHSMVAHGVVSASAYLITAHPELIHLSLPPGSVQWPTRMRALNREILDAAALFFEENPTAQAIILTMISLGGDEAPSKCVKAVMWW
jgi:hypothetical protein